MQTSIEPVRSWLFTPGTRPERFNKAAEIGADVLIIDLEDAVAPTDKAAAREIALTWITANISNGFSYALRVNGLDTVAGITDLDALLKSAATPDYLVLPKTETPGHVEILDRLLRSAGKPTRIIGIIESARGLSAVEAVAGSSSRLAGLMFGAADMAADLGCIASWEALAFVRSRIVAACALGGIAAIDSPFFDIADEKGCFDEVRRAVGFGFTAKAAIHPSQITGINAALTPSREAIEEARAILTANTKGVGIVDGKMIDEAVARKARRTLAFARD